ncbi:hypothetical protein HK096_009602, partial [Nowakowskiella sp. JEL0078]
MAEFAHNLYVYVFSRSQTSRAASSEKLSPEIKWTTKICLGATVTGMIFGCYMAGSKRSLQFMAENAHRFPVTNRGWYFYHKHKNYEVIDAGFRGAFRQGARFAPMALLFCLNEQIFETLTGRESFINTMGA